MKKIMNTDLSLKNLGEEVTLYAWINKIRDQGFITFIDLRDRSGIIQVSVKEDNPCLDIVKTLKKEYVVKIKGIVKERESKNPKLKTGDIEIDLQEIEILNKSLTLPFELNEELSNEDTRLKYRYLDLRREELQRNLITRHKVELIIRNYLDSLDFIEVETPILSKATPEGARDYLVPSRLYNGSFYALPQSPQVYKQLLMIGGMEKYFQLARCFRDEDLRSDRQPEFTQLDIEMSFVDEEDIYTLVSNLMKEIFKKLKNLEITEFPRMKYVDAIRDYGSDKPDLRFDMKIIDLKDIINVEILKDEVNCLVLKNLADKYSRKNIDKLNELFKTYTDNRLLNLKIENNEVKTSFDKFITDKDKETLRKYLNLENNDIVFITSGKYEEVKTSLGFLRKHLALEHDLINKDIYKFLWVTEFPMYEYDKEESRYVSAHHPFTSPKKEDVDKLLTDKENCYSRAYDLVLNGYELLSGSVRIHNKELQAKVFEAIGMTIEDANDKFGFFMEAFNYGAPPHAGVGIGIERLLMILQNTDNIRDVVAFPKTLKATDLMSSSPSGVYDKQLIELGIEVKEK
jgi:aspartate--tRNA ligase